MSQLTGARAPVVGAVRACGGRVDVVVNEPREPCVST